MALATFFQLLRPRTIEEQRHHREYCAHVHAATARACTVFDEWERLREVEGDYARLANAAAVNRWELMRLARQSERIRAPRALSDVHRDVVNAVTGCARAFQLLANGYRFHKSEALCDGQALLLEAVKDLEELGRVAENR